MTQEEMLIRLGIDPQGFESGLKKVQNNARASMTEFAKDIGAKIASAFAVESVIRFGEQVAENAHQLEMISNRLDITIEEVQRLKHVADMTGSSIETITTAFDRLAVAKEKALGGNEAPIKAFLDMGISLADINSMSPEELFKKLSDSIQKTGINAKVTADLIALMGRNAGELKPVLEEYSKLSATAGIIPDYMVKNAAEAKTLGTFLKEGAMAMGTAAVAFTMHPIDTWKNTHFGTRAPRIPSFAEQMAAVEAEEAASHKPWQGKDATKKVEITKQNLEYTKKAAEIEKEITKQKEQSRLAGLTTEQKRDELVKHIHDLEMQIQGAPFEGLNPSEVAALRLDKEKSITEEKKIQAELDKENERKAKDSMTSQIHSSQVGAEYNTIENIAGRRWMARLNRFYGPGGRGDLSNGSGPIGDDAREYELAKYQQLWDRTHGNIADANNDITRMMNAQARLVEAGAASPEQLLGKIGDDTGKLRELFYELVDQGVIIKGTD